MAANGRSVPVKRLRAAAVERVQQSSLRETARAIGMSSSGLHQFLEDGVEPYPKTYRKLLAWYVTEQNAKQQPIDTNLVQACLDLLTQNLPIGERDKIKRQILDLLGDSIPRRSEHKS